MFRLSRWLLNRHTLVLLVALILGILAGLGTLFLRVNYNLSDYLPTNAPSTQALHQLQNEFSSGIPNLRIAFPNRNLSEAQALQTQLRSFPQIQSLYWLDTQWALQKPLEFASPALRKTFWNQGNAQFLATLPSENPVETLQTLRSQLPQDTKFAGSLVDQSNMQTSSRSEMTKIFLYIFPLTLLFLAWATHSYWQPIPIVLAIFYAVLLNLGTNWIFGEISFLTLSVSPVLQMAVSLDYAIFLIHRYESNLKKGMDLNSALAAAVRKSSLSISAASSTTLFGFLALLFMRFRIGPDLGIVLAKGIFFSLFSVLFLLPSFLKWTAPLNQKLQHRNLLPSFQTFSKYSLRWGRPLLILLSLLILPAFLAQSQTEFRYGMDALKAGSREAEDRAWIQARFGTLQQAVLLVPKDHWPEEQALIHTLQTIPGVEDITSYSTQVGPEIPEALLPPAQKSLLLSEHSSRIILTLDLPSESPEAFASTLKIREEAKKQFGSQAFLASETATLLDMKQTVSSDIFWVNGLAILAIALVLLVSFRSLSIPLLLLLTIEAAIWFNLSIPYFTSTQLSFIGYLVISTIQLGATVDYAILYTQNYLHNRKTLLPKQAAQNSIQETVPTLITPAFVLTLAGILLYFISSIDVVQELGKILARGTALSFLLVLLYLPTLLCCTDRIVIRWTFGARKESLS